MENGRKKYHFGSALPTAAGPVRGGGFMGGVGGAVLWAGETEIDIRPMEGLAIQ